MATELHSPPRFNVVLAEQIRSIGLAVRGDARVFLVVLVGCALLGLLSALDSRHDPRHFLGIGFSPLYGRLTAILGLLAPLLIWRLDGRPRRQYHWAMPVPRATHAAARSFGFVWLLIGVLLFLIIVRATSWAMNTIVGVWPERRVPGVAWLAAFSAASVAFAIGSAIAIGSRYPWRWLIGLIVASTLVGRLLDDAGSTAVANFANEIMSGPAGLEVVLSGQYTETGTLLLWATTARWAATTSLWLVATLPLLVFAARRHPEQ